MSNINGVGEAADSHWFSDKPQDVLIFKINRRPIASSALQVFDPPEDVYEHLKQTLKTKYVVRSGRSHQRNWRVGQLKFNDERREVTGQIGWTREAEQVENYWDEESQSFLEKWGVHEDSAVAPFSILAEGELVGVLRHSSFSTVDTVNKMFQQILNDGEREAERTTTIWNVDAMGDSEGFEDWFESMDQVLNLTLVVKRPNPDGAAEFEAVERRLEAVQAELIQEHLVARDKEVGLDKAGVRNDRTIQSFITAALRSYGYVKGKGRKNGRTQKYNQTDSDQLKETIDNVGSDWETATERVLQALRRVRDRRRD
jgi:hypothetical protein